MTRLPSNARPLAALALSLSLASAPAAAQTRTPVPGAEAWGLADRLPGVEQRSCTVRTGGPEASMTLVINNQGVPVLMIGRSDWAHPGAEIEVGVAIDGAAPATLRGSAVASLVLLLLADAPLLARLRGARTLDWRFPFGRFRTEATGFGAALDALRACHGATGQGAG